MVKLFDFRESNINLRTVSGFNFFHHFRQAMQGLGPKNDIYVRRARKDFLSFLACYAPPDSNEHIVFMGFFFLITNTAQFREDFFLRFFSNGTGIEHHQVCFFNLVGAFIAIIDHEVNNFFRVVLVHLAAKAAHIDFFRGHGLHPLHKMGFVLKKQIVVNQNKGLKYSRPHTLRNVLKTKDHCELIH